MLYLTCTVSFYMLAQSVYPQIWSLHLHVISWKMKSQFIIRFFFTYILYLTCITNFYMGGRAVYLYVWSLYSWECFLYTLVWCVYLQAQSVVPAGSICNQIRVADTCGWIFVHTCEFLTTKNKFLQQLEFSPMAPWDKIL